MRSEGSILLPGPGPSSSGQGRRKAASTIMANMPPSTGIHKGIVGGILRPRIIPVTRALPSLMVMGFFISVSNTSHSGHRTAPSLQPPPANRIQTASRPRWWPGAWRWPRHTSDSVWTRCCVHEAMMIHSVIYSFLPPPTLSFSLGHHSLAHFLKCLGKGSVGRADKGTGAALTALHTV